MTQEEETIQPNKKIPSIFVQKNNWEELIIGDKNTGMETMRKILIDDTEHVHLYLLY